MLRIPIFGRHDYCDICNLARCSLCGAGVFVKAVRKSGEKNFSETS